MEWLHVAGYGVASLLVAGCLIVLINTVDRNTRAVEAMRETLERECGAGLDD